MTQAKKLEALVRRAIEGGWDYSKFHYVVQVEDAPSAIVSTVMGSPFAAPEGSPFEIIFNHDFARALFGDGEPRKYNGFNLETSKMMTEEEKELYIPKEEPLWKQQLRKAVISKDPINYMYKEVFGDA